MGCEVRCLDPRCKAQVAKEKWVGVIPNPVFFFLFSMYGWKPPPSDSLGELKKSVGELKCRLLGPSDSEAAG